MTRRILRTKLFLGSTTEELDEQLSKYLQIENICPGNYIDYKLYKHGGVYQLIFVYAKLLQ